MSRCGKCGKGLTCPSCNGRRGGQTVTPKRLAAMTAARRSRYRWNLGQRVTSRIKRERVWAGTITAIGTGRRGQRPITVRVERHDRAGYIGQALPYETIVAESMLARLPARQKAVR